MFWLAVALVATLSGAHAQITAQANVAPELRECYVDLLLQNRNNIPPMTIQVLIDIIQKIEDSPDVNVDLRVLSALLLHTYRQDGIEYHQPESSISTSSVVMPFAPTFHSFHRHRLLLTKLIPSNLLTLPNTTISSASKCALHHMLSTTIDARVRGDENTCGQLSQYRALRTSRDTRFAEQTDDVQIFQPPIVDTEYGQMRQFDPNLDVEFNSNNNLVKFERQLLGESTCPILTGVIRTRWGAVSAGNLIAGIAAGAEMQQVALSTLTKGTMQSVSVQTSVVNLYPATLSGDLSEAVLIQGARGRTSISIGSVGNWNSTQAPRYYMLSTRQNVEMTDPEIRGDLDGFILGSSISRTLQTFNSLKLSQLLDMYYAPRNGVFDSSLRACNRQQLSQAAISDTNLVTQTEAFAVALNANMPLPGTITNGLNELVVSAITNFQTYTQNNLNDLNCVITETISDSRVRTNLYIVLDATYQYQTIYPAISYLVDAIEVGKYGSSITILSAQDGSIVVSQTFHQSDFHSEYTLLKHQSMLTGVNLETAFTSVRSMMQSRMEEESRLNYVGGNATVLLFMLNSGNLQNNQGVLDQARVLNETVPDLRILFATSTNQFDSLWNLVRDMHNDIHVVSLTSTGVNIENNLAPVLNRVLLASRRIINPLCGFEYTAGSSGSRTFDDFVEPNYINFYAVSPNYFYGNNDNTRVRIARSSAGSGTLTICHSRTVTQPRRNSTIVGLDDNLITCQDLASSGNVEITLQGACNDYSTIGSCPPLYISVQAVSAATTFTASCTDTHLCRFPYDIRFSVQVEELQCFSSGSSIAASLIFVVSALLLNIFRLQ